MRRAMLAALSVMALALASPGAALAHHGHRGHHKDRSKAHHARVRFEHFGASAPASPSSTDTSTSSQPTTKSSSSEIVGTVTSFENEILTITLSDGSIVKGKVTSRTEIECVTATPTTSSAGGSPGDDKGSGDDQASGDDQQSSDEHGDEGEDGGDDAVSPSTTEPPCDSSALKPGAGVREAELRIGEGGSEFESVELAQ
jgi:hypothetical protein